MVKISKSSFWVAFIALSLTHAQAEAQSDPDAVIQSYDQRFVAIGEQATSNLQRISGWSSTLSQFVADSRISRTQRAALELRARCNVTIALDQHYLWTTLENSQSYATAENILNLNVVTTNTISSIDDLRYAQGAAECLWRRYHQFETASQSIDFDNYYRTIAYEDAAMETINRSIALRELIVESVGRLSPNDPVALLNARIQLCGNYLEHAVAFRRMKYPLPGLSEILSRANSHCAAAMQDMVIVSGTTPQAWFDLKVIQIASNLGSGESEQAAQFAIEMIAAWVAIGNDRQDAINHVTALAEQEVSSRRTYQQHLDRLVSERGW